MKQDGNIRNKLEKLEGVLDTFGSDMARWPAAEREALETLVRADKPARRLYDEAKALERLMDTASAGTASAALSSHIVAAALEDGAREATVIPLLSSSQGVQKHDRTWRASQTRPIRRAVSMWPAAALAASFAFGLYMGATDIGGAAVEDVLRVTITDSSRSDASGAPWLEDSTSGDGGGLL